MKKGMAGGDIIIALLASATSLRTSRTALGHLYERGDEFCVTPRIWVNSGTRFHKIEAVRWQ